MPNPQVKRHSSVTDINGLTEKQERFCQAVARGAIAKDAYREAYPDSKASSSKGLLKNPLVQARINSLKERTSKRNEITVDMLLEELEEARIVALRARVPQAAAAISATMGKARLSGLDKQIMVHLGADGKELPPTRVEIVAATPSITIKNKSDRDLEVSGD